MTSKRTGKPAVGKPRARKGAHPARAALTNQTPGDGHTGESDSIQAEPPAKRTAAGFPGRHAGPGRARAPTSLEVGDELASLRGARTRGPLRWAALYGARAMTALALGLVKLAERGGNKRRAPEDSV